MLHHLPGRHDLAKSDAAVVRRDTLMPVSRKPGVTKGLSRSFGKVAVLKTASAQRHALLSDTDGGVDDNPGESIVELCRDHAAVDVLSHFIHDFADHGF